MASKQRENNLSDIKMVLNFFNEDMCPTGHITDINNIISETLSSRRLIM